MSTAYVVVTVVAAAMAGFSAAWVLLGAEWVLKPLADYGVPRAWGPWLGAAKAAGAAGLGRRLLGHVRRRSSARDEEPQGNRRIPPPQRPAGHAGMDEMRTP